MSYLREETIKLLHIAYTHEISNMLKYDYISSWLDVKGFSKLSNYYKEWALEEKEHSLWVKEFLMDLNIPIKLLSIPEINMDLDSNLVNFADVTLETEDSTTELYEKILDIAHEFEDSAMLIQFANKMLIEQIEETDKANTINDKILNIGDNKSMLQLFDNTF